MPGNQEYVVGLRFTADASAARQELDNLKNSLSNLNKLSNTDFNKNGITKGLNEAATAAAQLKVQLEEATNIKTGNLDLGKFNQSLKNSGMSLAQYKAQLEQLGPEGQQAFYQLTSSIQSAEIPLLRLNKVFGNLWDNLKRTAGWQISSSVIHGFMGAIQKAYGYAQDLNHSLNDIRIVTGQNVDQMARFAEVANKSAKALSTSTNEYVKASLIYYQQGLNDQAVKERTDVTVKMANVTGESAQTVSDQMTAVWNNFAKGSETVESFADKMVALGAETASSSDEIARGLEKFAAVADTVGLSFDYAAAALTTITATTRQSADTVGTALKTLFARMEGLKLGETLDDGTDLNKYSEALASIGVNIKDVNGELKGMDAILDETMVKWKTLSKDQQVALAQTVAGVRQYTQFVALMDNADFFKENLETAANAEGALQEQADIYAESWEAAQKRVKASMETIYSELIDDEFFIKITNGIAKAIDGIGEFIKSIGGAKGVLLGLSSIILKIFGDQVTNGITNMTMSIKNLITQGKEGRQLQEQATVLATSGWKNQADTQEGMAKADTYSKVAELQGILNKRATELSDTDLRINQMLIDRLKYLGEAVAKEAALVDKKKEEYETEKSIAKEQIDQLSKDDVNLGGKRHHNAIYSTINRAGGENENQQDLSGLQQMAHSMGIKTIDESGQIKSWQTLREEIAATATTLEGYQAMLHATVDIAGAAGESQGALSAAIDQYRTALQAEDQAQQEVENAERNLADLRANHADATIEIAAAEARVAAAREGLTDATENMANAEQELTEATVNCAQASKRAGANVSEEATQYKNAKTSTDRLMKSQQLLNASRAKTTKAIDQQANSLANSTKGQQLYSDAAKKAMSSGEAFGKSEQHLINTNNSFANSFESIKNKVSSVAIAMESYAKKFVTVASGASQLMMGLSSLGSILDTLKDPDTSGWEKFKSVIMSLGMGLPMVITGFQKMAGPIAETTTALIANVAAHQAGIALNQTEVSLLTLVTTLRAAKKAAIDGDTTSTAANNAVHLIEKLLSTDEIKNNAANIVLKNGKKVATEGDTAATIAQNIVQAILNGELTITNALLGIFNVSLGAVLITILAVVAGIAALVAVIALIIHALGEANREMESAANQTKEAGEAAKESADRYKELKSSLDSLKDAKNTLKDLAEGSLEWKEAVLGINQQVLELIKNYPKLAQYMTNENGVLGITEEGMSTVLTEQLRAAQVAQQRQMSSQIAETNVQKKYGKDIGSQYYKDTASSKSDLANYLKSNDIDILRTTYGGYQGYQTATTNKYNNFSEDQLKEVYSAYAKNEGKLTGEDLQKYLANFEALTPDQINGLVAQLTTVCNQIDANTQAEIANTQNLLLASNTFDKNTVSQDDMNLITAITAEKEINGSRESSYKNAAGREMGANSDWKWNQKDKDTVAKDYIDMLNASGDGYTYKSKHEGGDNFTVTRENSEGELEYYQKGGGWSTEKTRDTMDYDVAMEKVKAFKDAIISETDLEAVNTFKEAVAGVSTDFDTSTASALAYRDEIVKIAQEQGLSANIADQYINTLDAEIQAKIRSAQQTESLAEAMQQQEIVQNPMTAIKGTETSKEDFMAEIDAFKSTLDEDDLAIFAKFKLDPNSQEDFKQQFETFKEDLEDEEIKLKVAANAEEFDLNAGDLGELADIFDERNEALSALNDSEEEHQQMLKADAEAAADAATRFQRLNDAVQDLYDNFDDYEAALKDVQKATSDTDKALAKQSDNFKKLRTSLAGLLDTSEDLIDNNFLDALNPDDLEKAAMGDAEAIGRIRDAFIDAQAAAYDLANDPALDEFKNKLAGLEDGAIIDIDNEPFLQKLIEAALAAGATADDIESMLSGFGIDADVEPFMGSMEDLKAASQAAAETTEINGDAIVGNMSFDATTNTLTTEETDTQEDTGFIESVTQNVRTAKAIVPENSGSGKIEYTAQMPYFTKTVTPEKKTEENKKQQTVNAVQIKNAHKSAGGNVSTNRQSSTSPRSSSGSCFVAGTLISTLTGYKPIESISLNDLVLSYNEDLRINQYSKVLQTMIHQVEEPIYTLIVENEKLEVTGNHRLYISRNNITMWLPVEQLKQTDKIMRADGVFYAITKITSQIIKTTVYNFEVSNNHNYYVGKSQILAHNKGGSCFIAGTQVSTMFGFKPIELIHIGDMVLSYNETLRINQYSKVLQTMIHTVNEKLYTLIVGNDELTVTGNHKLYIDRGGIMQWLPVERIRKTDKLILATGISIIIDKICSKIQQTTVYNFEVSNNHNYYVGESQILAHNKGGSGGSGSTKEAAPAKTKKSDDEIERYHEIDQVLEDIANDYDEIGKLTDRAFGDKHIKNMEKEVECLKAQNAALDQKIALNKQYLAQDQSAIAAYGASFDAKGRITNYNALIESQVAQYNAEMAAAATLEDDARSDRENEIEEAYSLFKELLEQYEETLNMAEDLAREKAETIRQIFDTQLSEVDYKVNIVIDYSEFRGEREDWYLSQLEDKKFAGAERLLQYDNQGIDQKNNYNAYLNGTKQLLATAGASEADIEEYLNGNVDAIAALANREEVDMATLMEHLRTNAEGMMEAATELMNIRNKIYEELQNEWNEYNEEFEYNIGLYDKATSKLDHFQNMIDIIGKRASGVTNTTLQEWRQKSIEVGKATIDSLKEQLEFNEKSAEILKQELDKTEKGSQEYYILQGQWREMQEKIQDVQEQIYSTAEETAEKVRDAWQQTFNEMIEEYEEKISGTFRSLEQLQEAFDQEQTLVSQYLPEYKKIYELSKLNRNIAKEMEKLDSTRSQQKLRDLQKEINQLQQDGVEMSKYDLEYLQKRYELKLAEIALEDARNAKNMVRLRRDANGNYGYVYTANEEAENDAIQRYEDALYAAQDITENYINEMSEQYLATLKEMTEAIAGIHEEDFASVEEYQARVDQVRRYYSERLQFFANEVDKAISNNVNLYENDYVMYTKYTGQTLGAGDQFVTDFRDTVIGGLIGNYDTLNEHYDVVIAQLGTFNDGGDSLLGRMGTAYKDMQEQLSGVLQQSTGAVTGFVTDSSTGVENLETTMSKEMPIIDSQITQVTADVTTLGSEATSAFTAMASAASSSIATVSSVLSEMTANVEQAVSAYQRLYEAQNQQIFSEMGTDTTFNGEPGATGGGSGGGGGGYDPGWGGSGGGGKGSGGSGSSGGGKSISSAQMADLVYDIANGDYNNNPERKRLIDQKFGSGVFEAAQAIVNKLVYNSTTAYHWHHDDSAWMKDIRSAVSAAGYDTGGYTGSWGAMGKLAVLHEKELVLNKMDTENMLSAISLLRQVSNDINLQASAQQGILVGRTNASGFNGTNSNGTIEQQVSIQAEFPAASDRNEIQEAFHQLMDQALQYAYRPNY